MKALAIAAVELKRFIRDRANLFFVFILPIGIILLIGAQFGGPQGARLGVHAGAGAGEIGQAIVASLEAEDDIVLVAYDSREALVGAIERGTVAAGVNLPDDLPARLASGEVVPAELIAPQGSISGQFASVVGAAIAEATMHEAAVRLVTGRGAERGVAEAAVSGLEDAPPPIAVAGTEAGESLFEGVTSGFQIGSTSQLVLFMFVTALSGSAALIQSRRYGVIRRMLGTPTSSGTVILGESLGRFGVVIVQGLYIIAATALLFQIGWGNPLGAAAVVIAFSAIGAAAAILFGTLFRNDQQAATVGVIAGLGLGALGGCMLPLELFPDTLKTIAHFTPHAWALDAFAALTRRDASIVDILPELGVLIGFAVVLLGLAVWRMRATLGRVV